MKSHGENTRIKLKDLAEGCLLVDTKERIWVVMKYMEQIVV